MFIEIWAFIRINMLHLKNVIRQSGSEGECLKMRYLLKHFGLQEMI